jgi:hypothetical protein
MGSISPRVATVVKRMRRPQSLGLRPPRRMNSASASSSREEERTEIRSPFVLRKLDEFSPFV